jgi:hypothetical protein
MSRVTAAVFLNHRHQEMCGQLQVLSDLLAGKAIPVLFDTDYMGPSACLDTRPILPY